MKNKDIEKIAKQIVDFEKKIEAGEAVPDDLEKLILTLDINDLFEIDDYIMQEKLLTK